MSENDGYETVNTCSRQPNCTQITAYVVFLSITLVYWLAILPYLPSHTSVLMLSLAMAICLLIVIISTLLTSKCDPVDPIVFSYLSGDRE